MLNMLMTQHFTYTNVLDNSFSDMISSAVKATNSWASANNILLILNTDKTVLVNSTLSRKHKYNKRNIGQRHQDHVI